EGGPCKDEFGNMGSGVSKQSSFYYNLYDDVYAIIHVSIVNCSTDNLYANFDLEKAIQEEIDNGEDFALAVAIIENAQRKENSADQVVSFSTNNNQYASNVDLTLTVPSQYIVSKYKETSESDLFRLGTDVVDVTYNGSTLSFYFISEALPTPFSNLVNLGYHKSFGQLYSAIPEAQLPTDNTIEYSDSSITDCYSGQGDECLIFSVGVDSRDSTFFSASCTSPTNDFTDCDNMIKGITFE
ncbi:hypothetical protein KC678_04345, partial [Candidatus Dojkabacteria bacterium]|nr:hypothetical protein [Candidatus Dojkabacteria bacterium]